MSSEADLELAFRRRPPPAEDERHVRVRSIARLRRELARQGILATQDTQAEIAAFKGMRVFEDEEIPEGVVRVVGDRIVDLECW